jgi:hypothetical protein
MAGATNRERNVHFHRCQPFRKLDPFEKAPVFSIGVRYGKGWSAGIAHNQSFVAFKVAPESGHRSPDSDSAAGKLLSG